ncbi:hypothetical protein F5141DRAFT_1060202 [Pisolithus sp. B1]|nr:hypothetical protein F5141DRAFT_1060202 [Pisolithus sp. B1]
MLDVRLPETGLLIIQLYSGAHFMSEVGDEEVLSKVRYRHGDKYGDGFLSASVQRGKINNTWQPPKHGVFNEASEVRAIPAERHSGVAVEGKLHATRTGSFAAQDNNPGESRSGTHHEGLIQANSIICQCSMIAKDSAVMEPANINR